MEENTCGITRRENNYLRASSPAQGQKVKHRRDRAEQWLGLPVPVAALASSPPDP